MNPPSRQQPVQGADSTPGSFSRRRFLHMAGGIVGAGAVGLGAFEAVRQTGGGRVSLPSMPVHTSGSGGAFYSRPDLRPPEISVPSPRSFDGDYLFLGAVLSGSRPGPLMVDHEAQPVWFRPISPGVSPSSLLATNFRPFTYRDLPVLAWWEGHVRNGLGLGEAILVDRSYREVARVRAAAGRQMDLHEFQLTPQGTALFTCYPETVQVDLRSIGGPRRGAVLNSIFQEVDVRTGRLLLEWRSLDHIDVSETYVPSPDPQTGQRNYLHLNSIGLTPDGNLLVSGRQTGALYKLDRRSGRVMWRLGGKRSDFTIGPGAEFRFQHDARQLADGSITLFDNGTGPMIKVLRYSRGLMLKVDEASRKVSLAQAFTQNHPLLALTMGSVQIQPNGNLVVGWGIAGHLSEFTPKGRLLTDAQEIGGSYRVLRLPWRGTPERPPDVFVDRSASIGRTIVYVSWNGDTETAYWQVHVGDSRHGLRSIGIARRRGFETAISVGDVSGYFAVTALDQSGRPLGHSSTVRL